ncbi:hypothetical protein BKA63DRAFT_585218 [Paraphoma chrysanthemicola]|nr:hypothetical protein BKA63DRAFT_585218 [Paraphoma chrysanthemicola]
MGKIFSSAEFVIAAAHGDNMDSGIPGVGYPRRVRQQTVTLPGLTVTNVVRGKFEEPLEVWRRRGWTYQEAVLARRLLLFYGARVVYEGAQYTESEDRFDRGTFPLYMISNDKPSVIGGHYSFLDYARHVQNYAARSLSFQIDTYAAFDGITQALYGQSSTHFALPLLHFDCALRWYTSSYVTKHSARVVGGVCFPTWSWTSMVNQECKIMFGELGYYGSLVAWYKLEETEPPSLKVLNDRPDTGLYPEWQTYMAIACAEGCIVDTWCSSLGVRDWAEFRNKFTTRWPNYDAFYEQLTSQAPHEPHLVELMRQMPGTILGRTQISLFSVRMGISNTQLDIVNSDGGRVGALYGEVNQIGSALQENNRLGVLERDKYEFVALSISTASTRYPYTEETYYVDARGVPSNVNPAVDVMMVSWDGLVARREGLGWIHLMNWAASDREWKTILLQ